MGELLEPRRLFAAVLEGTAFRVNGTAGDDVIEVSVDGDAATVTDNGVTSTFTLPDRVDFRAFLGEGDDRLTVTIDGRDLRSTIYGGTGDDVIDVAAGAGRLLAVAQGGNDSVTLARGDGGSVPPRSTVYGNDGDDGDDSLEGAAGRDLTDGGVGADTLRGSAATDNLAGGAGTDLFAIDERDEVTDEDDGDVFE